MKGDAARYRAKQLLLLLCALLYVELTSFYVGDDGAGLAKLLTALKISSDLVLRPMQLRDLLGPHEQLHLGVAVQPELKGFL